MILSSFLLILGIALLFYGAEILVRGASQSAISLGVPPIVVGLTVVSIATSLPEAIASFIALLKGDSGDIALGNIMGSNIANIALITGCTSLIMPIPLSRRVVWRETPIMLGVTSVLALFMIKGMITRWMGITLLLLLGSYLALHHYLAKQETRHSDLRVSHPIFSKNIIRVLVGTGLLVIGGWTLVDGAVGLAEYWGISERVIGLTVIAIGTSCPELATSLVAAWKGHSDIAIGNVVGSNIFNILFVVGGVSTLVPVVYSPVMFYVDLPVLLFFSVGMWMLMWKKENLTRVDGAFLLTAYGIYLWSLI